MKKIFAFLLSAGLIAAIGMSPYSCAPPQAPETYDNYLYSTPTGLSINAQDSIQTTEVSLHCGCAFDTLRVTAFGGDTADIHFSFVEPLTDLITNHTLQATFHPSMLKNSGYDTAWIMLSYNDTKAPYGAMLYDTIRAYATY